MHLLLELRLFTRQLYSNGKCTEKCIDKTTTPLSKRLAAHTYNGSIKRHFTDQHNKRITQQHLDKNT